MVLLRFDKENKEWKEIPREEKEEKDLYLDGFLYKKLLFAKSQQAKNHDAGGLVCGSEGSGKSSCAGNIMRFMSDDSFDPLKEIIKDEEDALRVLGTCKKGQAIMFDEGYLLFMSTEVMRKGQRDLVKIFSIIRQKNLFFLVVAPSFFRLNSYFALDRTKFMIHVYTKRNERGFFSFFGEKKKAKLFRTGKKMHDYNMVRPNFRGRYTKCLLLENKEYVDIKEKTLAASFKIANEKKALSPTEIKRNVYKDIVKEHMDKPIEYIVPFVPYSTRTIKRMRSEIRTEVA